jgi:hypothetical protein
MWDWNHFQNEGWWRHTKRSAQLAGLLILSGIAMIIHLLVPFWQQPKALRREEVACRLCEGSEESKE